MPKPLPAQYETFTALTSKDGAIQMLAAEPLSDKPGFDGYLVPWYVLSDRGTFFVPGAFKKSAKERRAAAPHLYQHDIWEPIGKHAAAFEDETGFRIGVELNIETQRGAETYSNLQFGTPLAMSVGFDRLGDRTGTKQDEAKLDRSTAPGWENVPINELRAITEARWWESSTVTFPGLATAKPDTIHSAAALPDLIKGITDGTLSEEQLAHVRDLVAAYQASAAAATAHGTDDAEARRKQREQEMLARVAAYHGLRAQELNVA